MTTFGDQLFQFGGVPVGGLGSLFMGHVYYVMQAANVNYKEFAANRTKRYHDDGSDLLHNTIQSALDATKSERNDYVIVMPDDSNYNITAALTMTKRNVHLIAAGLLPEVGSTNAVKLNQSTADTSLIQCTVAEGCEIAGFYFKNAASTSATAAAIYSTSLSQCMRIHHNNFMVKLSGGTNSSMITAPQGGFGYSTVDHNNFFQSYGTSGTLGSCVYINATGAFIDYNLFSVGDGNTWTIAARVNGAKGSIKYNTFNEATALGAASAGTFTSAIYADGSVAIVGNRGACASGHMIAGGTNDNSYCDNRSGVNGGVLCVDQDIDA